MRWAAAVAVPVVALALVACDDGSGEPDSGAADAIPRAYLRPPDGDIIQGAVGTHCWADRCVDYAGPVTQADAVTVQAGQGVAISFEGGAPDALRVDWLAAAGTPPAPEEGRRAWPGLEPAGGTFTGTTAPAAPGAYVVVAFAQWDGKGDAAYGFYVIVEPER
jgi:hypothetical protein